MRLADTATYNSTMIPASTTSKHPQFPIPRFEILDILVFESTSIAGMCNASSSSLIFSDKSSPHSNGLCEREYWITVLNHQDCKSNSKDARDLLGWRNSNEHRWDISMNLNLAWWKSANHQTCSDSRSCYAVNSPGLSIQFFLKQAWRKWGFLKSRGRAWMKGRQAIEQRERGSGMARETESGKFVMMASESHWCTRSSLGENDEFGQPRGFVSKC